MSAEMAIFVVAVIAIVGWFAVGTHLNVRKGHQFLDWLQGGLPLVGEKTTLRWLGSSVGPPPGGKSPCTFPPG